MEPGGTGGKHARGEHEGHPTQQLRRGTRPERVGRVEGRMGSEDRVPLPDASLSTGSSREPLPQALQALTILMGNRTRSARHRILSGKSRGLSGSTGPSTRTTSSSWLRGSWPWRCLGLRQERRSWRRLFTSLGCRKDGVSARGVRVGGHQPPYCPSTPQPEPPALGTLTSAAPECASCFWSLAEVGAKERCPEPCREKRGEMENEARPQPHTAPHGL